MRFTHPEFLYLLLLAVPIIVFHMIRRRWRRQPVASLLLWEQALTRLPRRASLGILASLLSLLLLLAAVGAGSTAAAGPVVGHPGPSAKPLVIAVAASARMEGERWEEARALAAEEIRRKADPDPVTLILVSEAPRILAARETDPDRLLDRLSGAGPALVRANWGLAAEALADAVREGARAVAIGVEPDAPEGATVHRVGGGNAGITAFGVRVEELEVEILARTVGAGEGAELVVRLDGAEIERVPAAEEVEVSIDRGEGGLLEVAIEPGAGPSFDDAVHALIPAPISLKVGVVAEGGPDPFLRSALAVSGPLIDVEGSGSVEPDRMFDVADRFDVIVIAGEAPARIPPGNVILLTPPPGALGLIALPPAEASPIWEQAGEHPITRGVDAAEVQVMGAAPARLPDGAEPLLGVPGGAVAAVGATGGSRWVWIGLDPQNSTLPVTAAYPLLVRNALGWFAALRGAALPPAFATDGALEPRIPLPPGIKAAAIIGPGPHHHTVVDVIDGRFSWRPEVHAEGKVEVHVGAVSRATWANVVLPEESAAGAGPEAPVRAPVLGPDRSGLVDTEREFWILLAAAAGVFLLLEWLVTHVGKGD